MPKQQTSKHKTNATSSSVSNQSTDTASTVNSSASKKESNNNWVVVINLILTAIIGIGGIVEALYLNNQNEQSQLKIIQLQAAIQRNSTLAHLNFQQSTDEPTFFISNTGLAAASNVKLVITIDTVNKIWKSYINDIS